MKKYDIKKEIKDYRSFRLAQANDFLTVKDLLSNLNKLLQEGTIGLGTVVTLSSDDEGNNFSIPSKKITHSISVEDDYIYDTIIVKDAITLWPTYTVEYVEFDDE